MVSSKMSARRGILKRPPVCKSGPIVIPPPHFTIFIRPISVSVDTDQDVDVHIYACNSNFPEADPLNAVVTVVRGLWTLGFVPRNCRDWGGVYTAPATSGPDQLKVVVQWDDGYVGVVRMLVDVTDPP